MFQEIRNLTYTDRLTHLNLHRFRKEKKILVH